MGLAKPIRRWLLVSRRDGLLAWLGRRAEEQPSGSKHFSALKQVLVFRFRDLRASKDRVGKQTNTNIS